MPISTFGCGPGWGKAATANNERDRRSCSNCERCTWNPGDDCGVAEHPHCERCGHCRGRHVPMDYAAELGWKVEPRMREPPM